MRTWKLAVVAAALVLAGSGCTTIVRGNVASDGTAADAGSVLGLRSVSDSGRYVVFVSAATNLVPGDTNGVQDVFRHDNVTGQTVRVSVDNAGGQVSGPVYEPSISGDGDRVLFQAEAALEPADTNARADVYLRSITAGTTERVSIRPDGTPLLGALQFESILGAMASDDGRFVLMRHSYPNGGDLFVRDRSSGITRLLAQGVGTAVLSGDGQYVVADSLCAGGPCSFTSRVLFLPGGPEEIVDAACGFQALDVSSDGRFVVGRRFGRFPMFECPEPTGLVRWDKATRHFRKVPIKALFYPFVSISDSGRFVGALDDDFAVRVADLATDTSQIAESNGTSAALSGSGRYIAFTTQSPRVPDDTDTNDDVFTLYSVHPAISSATPTDVARGTSHLAVRVTGSELLPGATFSFSGSGITLHSLTVDSPTTLTLDLSVDPDAPPGPRDLVVSNRGGFGHSDAVCLACLTIT